MVLVGECFVLQGELRTTEPYTVMMEMKKALLTAIAISALLFSLVAGAYVAQAIPKPSVPEFTLQIVDYGVQMAIQNQPIIPNGYDTADIFYNIRIKSHDSENWVNTTVPNPSQDIRGYIGEIGTSGSTVIQKDFNGINTLLGLSDDSHQIDYQVEAINGYLNTTPAYAPPIGFDPDSTPVIVVNTSGWSNTQTITIPGSSASLSTSPTSTPTETPMPPLTPTPTQIIITIPTPTTTSPNQPNTQGVSKGEFYTVIAVFAVLVGALLVVVVVLAGQVKKAKAENKQ